MKRGVTQIDTRQGTVTVDLPPRTATVVVAASNASEESKSLADYICEGSNDHSQIQAALNRLPAAGGIVQLTEGTFNLTASLTLPSKPVRLVGAGVMAMAVDAKPAATVLTWTLGATGDCIIPSNDAYAQEVKGVELVGDGTDTRYGIYLQNSTSFKIFRDVAIRGMTTAGVRGDSGGSQNLFEKVTTRDIPDYGFSMYGVTNRYINCQAMRSSGLGVGGTAGFQIQESHAVYIGCAAERYAVGFNVANYCSGLSLLGCCGELNSVHVTVNGGAGFEPVGTTIVGFAGSNASSATLGAIRIARAFGTLLLGCRIEGSTSDIAYDITANAAVVTIEGGYTNDTTPVQDAGGANVTVRNLHGYITRNHGAASSISDGGTIAHGLAGTPTLALVTPSVAGEMASVTGLDGTNITVAIKKHDGSAGTSQTIYWRAYL